jgi:hypothetical protein
MILSITHQQLLAISFEVIEEISGHSKKAPELLCPRKKKI